MELRTKLSDFGMHVVLWYRSVREGRSVVAFSESELEQIDATVGELCRNLPPREHRDELRCVYDIHGHAVSVFEE